MQDEQASTAVGDLTGVDTPETPIEGADILLSDNCTQHQLLQAYHAAAAKLAMRGLRELPVNEQMPALTDNRVTAVNDHLYIVHGFDINGAASATLQRLREMQRTPLPMTVNDGTYTVLHISDVSAGDGQPSGVTVDDLLAIVQDQAERYSYIGRIGTVASRVEEIRQILREKTPV